MRDIASCFSENAINVSHSYSCSSSYSNNDACLSPSQSQVPSAQNVITCFYKIILSTQKQMFVTVTWCNKTHNIAQGLTINFGTHPSTSFKLNNNARIFRKKKGIKLIEAENAKIEVFWDLSSAKYDIGPEPVDGSFYVLIMVDSEIGLVLGDIGEEIMITKRVKTSTPVAKVSLVSRQEEHCAGNNFNNTILYATKAKFIDTGIVHDILIRCSGENEGMKHPVLSVCIDKKTAIRVNRLQWNFRGNQTLFVEGLVVDLMWDVHDWFFRPASSGCAVFMFRARSGMDSSSRLWLEENLRQKEQEKLDFSLFIYASKSPSSSAY